jgi:hypothetical protein
MLALAGLVGFGIALLTRSLFPASLVWGSLLLVALYAPTVVRSRRGTKWIMRGRTLIRILAALALAGVVLGFTPIGLLTDIRFQIVVVAGAMVILVEQWRGLVTETSVGYAKWYEDIDVRSSVFVAGVGLLTIDTIPEAFFPAACYFGIHCLEGELVTPMLLARRFTLNPVLVVISLLFWTWMWGLIGTLVTVPLMMIIKTACERIEGLEAFGELLNEK